MKIRDLQIRDFRMEDYPRLVELWQRAELPYKPQGRDAADKIRKEIQLESALFQVAILNQTLVGSVLGTHDGRKGWVNRLVVDPEYQGRGIASLLLKDLEERFESLGIEIFACLIDEGNDSSDNFFRARGYELHRDIYYYCKRRHPDV